MELSPEAKKLIHVFMFEPNTPGVYLLRFAYRSREYREKHRAALNELYKAGLVKTLEKTSKSLLCQYTPKS